MSVEYKNPPSTRRATISFPVGVVCVLYVKTQCFLHISHIFISFLSRHMGQYPCLHSGWSTGNGPVVSLQIMHSSLVHTCSPRASMPKNEWKNLQFVYCCNSALKTLPNERTSTVWVYTRVWRGGSRARGTRSLRTPRATGRTTARSRRWATSTRAREVVVGERRFRLKRAPDAPTGMLVFNVEEM